MLNLSLSPHSCCLQAPESPQPWQGFDPRPDRVLRTSSAEGCESCCILRRWQPPQALRLAIFSSGFTEIDHSQCSRNFRVPDFLRMRLPGLA